MKRINNNNKYNFSYYIYKIRLESGNPCLLSRRLITGYGSAILLLWTLHVDSGNIGGCTNLLVLRKYFSTSSSLLIRRISASSEGDQLNKLPRGIRDEGINFKAGGKEAKSVLKGESISTSKNPNNAFSNFFTKVCLFLIRVAIIIVGVILAKSFFLAWYNDNYTYQEFYNNIYSLSSAIIAIGSFTGRLLGIILDYTSLNIQVKDLFNEAASLWFSKTKSISSGKIYSTFFDNKLPLGVDEKPSSLKIQKAPNIMVKGISDSEESTSDHEINNSRGGKKRRSAEELAAARDKIRDTLVRRDGETDEQFEKRVIKTEINSHRVARRATIRLIWLSVRMLKLKLAEIR